MPNQSATVPSSGATWGISRYAVSGRACRARKPSVRVELTFSAWEADVLPLNHEGVPTLGNVTSLAQHWWASLPTWPNSLGLVEIVVVVEALGQNRTDVNDLEGRGSAIELRGRGRPLGMHEDIWVGAPYPIRTGAPRSEAWRSLH